MNCWRNGEKAVSACSTGTARSPVRKTCADGSGDNFIPCGAIALGSATRRTGVAYNATRELLAWTESTSPTSIYIANLATSYRRVELRGDIPGLIPVSFSENGNRLLGGGKDRSPWRAWDTETGQVVAPSNELVDYAMFAAGGRVLMTATNDEGKERHEIAFRSRRLGFDEQSDPLVQSGQHTASSSSNEIRVPATDCSRYCCVRLT